MKKSEIIKNAITKENGGILVDAVIAGINTELLTTKTGTGSTYVNAWIRLAGDATIKQSDKGADGKYSMIDAKSFQTPLWRAMLCWNDDAYLNQFVSELVEQAEFGSANGVRYQGLNRYFAGAKVQILQQFVAAGESVKPLFSNGDAIEPADHDRYFNYIVSFEPSQRGSQHLALLESKMLQRFEDAIAAARAAKAESVKIANTVSVNAAATDVVPF